MIGQKMLFKWNMSANVNQMNRYMDMKSKEEKVWGHRGTGAFKNVPNS